MARLLERLRPGHDSGSRWLWPVAAACVAAVAVTVVLVLFRESGDDELGGTEAQLTPTLAPASTAEPTSAPATVPTHTPAPSTSPPPTASPRPTATPSPTAADDLTPVAGAEPDELLDAAVQPLFAALDDRFVGRCDQASASASAADSATCAVATDLPDPDVIATTPVVSFWVWLLSDYTGDPNAPFTVLDGIPSMSTAELDGVWTIVRYRSGSYPPVLTGQVDLGPDGVASLVPFRISHREITYPGASPDRVIENLTSVLGPASADGERTTIGVCTAERIIEWGDLQVGFNESQLVWWHLSGPADDPGFQSVAASRWPFGESVEALELAIGDNVGPAQRDGDVTYHEFDTSPTGASVRAIVDSDGTLVGYEAGDCSSGQITR
ncbi:MAG: hypothetical protein KDB21_10845 [Acidimicrobiales bacterium]|nr:hypothetical protein [Acidimicrobiales bacterium]